MYEHGQLLLDAMACGYGQRHGDMHTSILAETMYTGRDVDSSKLNILHDLDKYSPTYHFSLYLPNIA